MWTFLRQPRWTPRDAIRPCWFGWIVLTFMVCIAVFLLADGAAELLAGHPWSAIYPVCFGYFMSTLVVPCPNGEPNGFTISVHVAMFVGICAVGVTDVLLPLL